MGEGQQLRDRDTRAIGLDLRKKEKEGQIYVNILNLISFMLPSGMGERYFFDIGFRGFLFQSAIRNPHSAIWRRAVLSVPDCGVRNSWIEPDIHV